MLSNKRPERVWVRRTKRRDGEEWLNSRTSMVALRGDRRARDYPLRRAIAAPHIGANDLKSISLAPRGVILRCEMAHSLSSAGHCIVAVFVQKTIVRSSAVGEENVASRKARTGQRACAGPWLRGVQRLGAGANRAASQLHHAANDPGNTARRRASRRHDAANERSKPFGHRRGGYTAPAEPNLIERRTTAHPHRHQLASYSAERDLRRDPKPKAFDAFDTTAEYARSRSDQRQAANANAAGEHDARHQHARRQPRFRPAPWTS